MGHGENDKRDMQRLGKKQEFKRNFSFWSALGFVGKKRLYARNHSLDDG
jgi:hypothetical protein